MTEFLIYFTIMVVISVILHFWKKDEEQTGDTEETAEIAEAEDNGRNCEEKDTQELVCEVLTKLGCQYEVDKDKEEIKFLFQGGAFIVHTSENSLWIEIYYLAWLEHDMDDIDGYADLRRIVNEANKYPNVVTVYTIDNNQNKVVLHSYVQILFVSQIPHLELYLKGVLEGFFKNCNYVYNEFNKQRTEVADNNK